MAAQTIETLLVSANGAKLVAALKPAYQIQTINDPGKAMEALQDAHYELILLDDVLFRDDIASVVKEIKRRVPLIPVLVLSENSDPAYQTDLMEAGADDFLTADLPAEEMHRRLKLIMRGQRRARALAQRNQNLQATTMLARRMHSATDPHTLIQDTIELACRTFKLYGMAIVLGEGETFELYAGREGGDGGLFESVVYLKDYDPFRRVIQSGIVQVFRNIVLDPNYVPIPVLPSPESAIVLPLNYQEHKFGAMAVFGTPRHPLSHDDLLIYELVASQFTVALHNARHYHSQRISAQSSQHLLRAWQRFINLQTYDDIAHTLYELVKEIPNVPNALVWMYSADPEQPEPVIKAGNAETARTFRQLELEGNIQGLLEQLDTVRMQPLTIKLGLAGKDPLNPLFKALKGQQLMLVPVMDSARLIGGIIASVVNNRQYSSDDAKLLSAGMAHAAALAVERATLIENMAEKSARLEALIRSTPQGIFFVDESGDVAFSNTQFTEMTNVTPTEVLGLPAEALLTAIGAQTDNPDAVRAQLDDAINRMLDSNPETREHYPIVEINLRNPERAIQVEFMIIGDQNSESGWAGIVQDAARFKPTYSNQTALMDMMAERIRVPYAQVRGLVTTLEEQHSRFTHRERARFLRQIEESVERLGHLWDNFLEMYNLDVAGLALSPEEVDLYEIVQRVLDSRAFADYRRQVQIEAPARLPLVELDELRLEQAIINVLHNAVRFSPKGAIIHLRLEHQGDDVQIVTEDQGLGIPSDQLERVFEPFYQASNNTGDDGAGLGLFLAREIVERHGGKIWIESEVGQGTRVTMALPIVSSGEARETREARIIQTPPQGVAVARRPEIADASPERVHNGRRVNDRQPQTIMSVEGSSRLASHLRERLETQGYEVIPYRSGEEALRDVNSIRLDLILLDVNLQDANGLDICERLCKRTEVPLIMLADEASEPERVRALMLGADDYIANPISDEELTVRVNVIFKRRRIPDRTREPLDLGSLYIDFARREVFLSNKPLELTRIEYDLLHTLAVNQGQVLTHKQLLEKVWGPEYQAETQYLWVNVSRLRKKLEPSADSPRYIHTQPGVGYVFRPS